MTAEIDPDTGYLAGPACPRRMTEVFIAGTAPAGECPIHGYGNPSLFGSGPGDLPGE